MTKPLVIAFTGKRGSGKSEAVKVMVEEFGFTELKFAGPLKNMLRAMYSTCGVDAETIERKIEGDLKEVPCEWLLGATPRRAMQTIGTEWRDGLVPAEVEGEEPPSRPLWAKMFVRAIQSGNLGDRIACSDYRFLHEGMILDEIGGRKFRIDRPIAMNAADAAAQHASEALIDSLPVDGVYENTGSLEELRNAVRALTRWELDEWQRKSITGQM